MGAVSSTIEIEGELVSKPYIDMTLAMMSTFGVQATHTHHQRFTVPGNQQYQSPGHLLVEGDASTASYFLAAAAIRGDVTVRGVGRRSLQGDVAFADVVQAMGAAVDCQDDTIRVQSTGGLRGVDVDLNHIPDAAMTVAILALFADGPTTIRNIYNWRIKETDRMTAMATELQRVGAEVTTTSDSITIAPPATLLPASIETYGDHRMAMCFSLVALGGTNVLIKNPEVTSKTVPDYFKIFESVCER
jgi:3-phosphoshikimate 1-carboxyvinyltransferase